MAMFWYSLYLNKDMYNLFPLEADQTEFIINSPSVCMNSIAQDKQKELVFTGQRLASLSREAPSSA